MAYIGKTPVLGNFVKLDAISVVNGQAAYTMQNGGVNFTSYDNVNQFLVSLNGILQSPTDSFTVSGSTLTFASNLSTGDVIDFVMVLGNTLDVGTPSDNTVSLAKINDTAKTFFTRDFRNLIINGDMSIAQRGTSTASITSTGYYTVDRWNIEMSSAGTWTQSQDTDVPTGQGFSSSLKMDCTTADAAPAAGDYMILQQRFEGQNLQYLKKGTSSTESLTLSFWVKSVKTGTFIAELIDNDNSRTISKSYTINSASTWEKKTITYTGDTTGSFNNDNAYSLGLRLWLVAGSTYSGGILNTSWNSVTLGDLAAGQVNLADNTANNFWITGVQLEAGTTASDFEFLPYDVNLQKCQRYYVDNIKIGGAGYATSSGQNARARTTVIFPTTMRATPSTSVANYSGGNVQNTVAFATTDTIGTTPSGESAASGSIYWNADLTIDAEL